MTGEEFIALSGRLALNRNAGAADFRSAVSRAYYGAFHLAIDLLRKVGANSGTDHANVQRLLFRSGHPTARQASQFLADLQSCRIRADYRLEAPAAETKHFAIQCVDMARDIQSQLAACESDPNVLELMRATLSA